MQNQRLQSLAVRPLVAVAAGLLAATAVQADDRALAVQGVPVTGPNSVLGQQLADFGPGGSTGSDLIAAYNPGGDEPLPLTPDTPLSTLVATTSDSADPSLINLPLRQVPTNISGDGEERASLPGQLDAAPLELNQTEPSDPITLGEWLEGDGQAVFKCPKDGPPTADVRVFDLIPNRVFTLWAVFDNGNGARPFGGAPNVIMTDEDGNGKFHRKLNFCPMDPIASGAEMDFIVVVYHSDQQNYATQPTQPGRGFPPGVVAHPQLQFTVNGTELLN